MNETDRKGSDVVRSGGATGCRAVGLFVEKGSSKSMRVHISSSFSVQWCSWIRGNVRVNCGAEHRDNMVIQVSLLLDGYEERVKFK